MCREIIKLPSSGWTLSCSNEVADYGPSEIRRIERIIEENQSSFLREWDVPFND